jgi:hypothetical protein
MLAVPCGARDERGATETEKGASQIILAELAAVSGVQPQLPPGREGDQKRDARTRPTPDPVRDAGFPTVEQLRRGIVLNRIAHSFWLPAHEPVFLMDWDGDTCFDGVIRGEHWAVSSRKDGAVAAF